MGILQQAFHKGLQIVEPQHVGRIAQPLVGIGMHFEKETVGPERLGRMRHGGHEFAVAARLAARRARRCTEWVQSITTVGAILSMSGILRKSTTRLL